MEPIRTVILRPYLKGQGPTFKLVLWDTERRDRYGKAELRYEFTQRESGHEATIFEGEDFRHSPLHAADSDATVAALLGFLTLRPGDTDGEHFDSYSELQLAFAEQHGEVLAAEVMARFGEG